MATITQSIDSAQPNFVMPNDWHGRRVDAVFMGRHVAHNVRLIGWNEHDADNWNYCVANETGKVFWVSRITFIDTDTETETETMNCSSPDGPVRMIDANGNLITPVSGCFHQLDELGEYLAELWPNAAVVNCWNAFMTAYDVNGDRIDSIVFGELPAEIRGELMYFDLAGIKLEFIEF